MKRIGWTSIASIVVIAAASVLAAPAARAGADISFGVNAPVGDDGRLFFSISSRYFDRDERVVDRWGRRFQNPDDLAVFLHILEYSHSSPEVVFNYRNHGMSWYDVSVRVGMPAEAWYVGPYGYARGPVRRHGHGDARASRWSDRDCRDFVAVRMAHEYYGMAPEVAMNWRHQGNDVRVMMTREYHQRHAHGDDYRRGDHHDHSHGDDRERGHGNGHGNGHKKHKD